MVQGKMKTKVQVPSHKSKNKQKHGHHKKSNLQKRGARYIAPKKAKQVQVAKLQKNISKAISACIEHDIISRASSSEPKQLAVLTAPSPDVEGKKAKKGKK